EQQRGGGVDGGRADGLVVQLLGGRPRRGGAQNVRERVRVRGAGAVAAVLQLHGAVQGERPSQGLLLVDEGLPDVRVGRQVGHHRGGARRPAVQLGTDPMPRERGVPDGAGGGAGQGQVEKVLPVVDYQLPGDVNE